MSNNKLSFQDMILTLQAFWSKQGANLMQAYDNEVGAGTMSPILSCVQMDRNLGQQLMYNLHVDLQMDVMVKILTAFSNTTNFKW